MRPLIASWVERFRGHGDAVAVVHRDQPATYRELADRIEAYAARIPDGVVMGLAAEYSVDAVALLFAGLAKSAIVAPVTKAFGKEREGFFDIAQVELLVQVDGSEGGPSITPVERTVDAPLLTQLKARGDGGLILFSSGATGRSKAVVHDGRALLERYSTPRRPAVTLSFMLFDHIGGMHTMLHTLSSGGTLVFADDHRPETVCQAVSQHKVQVFPATPTFINLLLLADTSAYDLSSVRYISYSAERMPQSTLRRLKLKFPNVRLAQNYGLSEAGILNAKSESSESLWIKLGGDGFETRVRDGMLEIKAKTAMLGYLNAESPFTEDGWLKTYDRVETKGEFVRILGRATDLIIVGGEKVYPAEVEDAILQLQDVVDVVVRGEDNAITGRLVVAEVHLSSDETRGAFRKRMDNSLRDKMADYKIPQRVIVRRASLEGARMKKNRTSQI